MSAPTKMTKKLCREVAELVLGDMAEWRGQCHAASVELVRSRKFPVARVARGVCTGVASQHSWVVLDEDVFFKDAVIVDPTLWSQSADWEEKLGTGGIWVGTLRDGLHKPHGSGSIWQWGRPDAPVGEPVTLMPRKPWSREAAKFLELLGPLDLRGWIVLAHAPLEGWPSAEIIDAMCEHPVIGDRIPIDTVGMVTDRNPGGLYLPRAEDEEAAA